MNLEKENDQIIAYLMKYFPRIELSGVKVEYEKDNSMSLILFSNN